MSAQSTQPTQSVCLCVTEASGRGGDRPHVARKHVSSAAQPEAVQRRAGQWSLGHHSPQCCGRSWSVIGGHLRSVVRGQCSGMPTAFLDMDDAQ